MTSKERRAYYRTWNAFQIKQEKYWLPKIYRVFQDWDKAVIAYMESNGIQATMANLDSIITIQPIMEVLQRLYVSVGLKRARIVRQQIKRDSQKLRMPTMGVNEQLTAQIKKYFELHLLNKAVIKITDTHKKVVLQTFIKGVEEGWSIDQMATQIVQLPYNKRHAKLVTRTEVVRAANAAAELEAQQSEIVLDKEWISAHDGRVRRPPKSKFDHWDLDGQVVPGERPFFSGGEELQFPGDPNGSAGNVIQCRCTVAYIPRRDANGKLIRREKPVATIQQPTAPALPVEVPQIGQPSGVTVIHPGPSNITEIITIGLIELFQN